RPEGDPGAVRRGGPALQPGRPARRRPPPPRHVHEDGRGRPLYRHVLPRWPQVRRADAAGSLCVLRATPVASGDHRARASAAAMLFRREWKARRGESAKGIVMSAAVTIEGYTLDELLALP